MIVRKIVVLTAVFAALSAFSGGCQSGGVGDPCTPEDEYQPRFAGFAASEVNIESRSFQCETRVCLVNHFRGRVSCPLGQGQNGIELPTENADGTVTGDDEKNCVVPGTSGKNAVIVAGQVRPQCKTRRAKDAVYCSCRCAGPDPDANYCDCPDGFVCTPFPELSLGTKVANASDNLTGSYCVRQGDTTTKDGPLRVNFDNNECGQEGSAADQCTPEGNCDQKVNNPRG